MTFSAINPSNWGSGAILTHNQMNTLAGIGSYITKALDKTGDNFSSSGGISGTIDILGGASGVLELVSISGTPLITISGSTQEFLTGSTLKIDSGGTLTINSTLNGTTTGSGTLTIGGTGGITFATGTKLQTNSGSTTTFNGPITCNGNFTSASSIFLNITKISIATSYTILTTDNIIMTNNSSTVAMTIPTGSTAGRVLWFRDTLYSNTTPFSITTADGLYFQGANVSPWNASKGGSYTIVFDGSVWQFIEYVSGV